MPAPDPAFVPVLEDSDLRLRAHLENDVAGIIALARDEQSLRWTTNIPTPYDETDVQEFLDQVRSGVESGTQRFWAIEVDGDFAGTINYTRHGRGQAELGYALAPGSRGRGVATRAARLVADFAFDTDGLEVLIWRAALGNLASRRVAWACGFRMDGVWPEAHVNSDGTYRDDLLVGHLRHDDPREPTRPWWEPAVLEDHGIRLRPWRESDAPAEAPDELAERFVVSAGMLPPSEGFPRWLLRRRHRMAGGEGVYWCIADRDSDVALGGVQVDQLGNPATHGTGSLGYWLGPEAQGRGLLQAALDLVIDHAFAGRDLAGATGLGLDRLWAGTDARNSASQRALRRAGFREVLTERRVLTREGREPADAISFELLASDDRDQQRARPAPPTVLTTTRLRLRPWRESDRPTEEPDANALRNMPARVMPTPQTWETWIARRQYLCDTGVHDFCIADSTTDQALGSIAVFGIDHEVRHGEVGYWLYPAARGQGYLDEALTAVVEHAFAPESDGGAGLDRLHAATVLDNYASRSALLRTGFRRWGEDHQAYVAADGERSDGAYYELLRSWRDGPSRAVTVPVLDGDRIRLRPWRMRDSARIAEACDDPTTRHWLSGLPHPYDEDIARLYVHSTRETAAAGESVTWCVADLHTDRTLGALEFAALRGPRPDTASVGYWAHPQARGQGAMSEALRVAIEHSFTPREQGGLGRRRLVLLAARENHASQAVARSRGFRRTGVEHQAERLGDGTVTDMLRFELLRDAPTGLPPRLTTTQVHLRPLELADAESIRETWADPATHRWIGDLPQPTDAAARRWIRDHRVVDPAGHGMCFTICRPDDDTACGALRILHIASGPAAGAEIGYWIHPQARGQGLATAALHAACTFAFTEAEDGGLGLTRITLGIAEGNDASASVARAAGFEQVGRDRRAEVLGDGAVVDLLRFDRLNDRRTRQMPTSPSAGADGDVGE